ncbi:hypothetical protein GCM10027416_05740 [Okibacterium endophyticum]
MPVLSRGKHRNPAKGACFMEFASYLAGEKWSDHPSCTHHALAQVARMVNDYSSDSARSRLSPLIPSVIGVNTDDPRLEIVIALKTMAAALPIASVTRQRSLAVGALVWCDYLERRGGSGPVDVEHTVRRALGATPLAEQWARDFAATYQVHVPRELTPRQSQELVALAIEGIGRSCIGDDERDQRLFDVLQTTIDDSRAFIDHVESHPRTEDMRPGTGSTTDQRRRSRTRLMRRLTPTA